MRLTDNIVINTYSLVLLLILNIYSLKSDEKGTFQNKLYIIMLQMTMLLLVVDILGRFDGKPDTIYNAINHFGNFMVFVFNCLLASLWLFFVYYQIYRDGRKAKRIIIPLAVFNTINIACVILTQYFGWYYYIDENNIYHRGRYYSVYTLFIILLLIINYVLIIIERKHINKKHYYTLVFFAIPPVICTILQLIFYGTSLLHNGIVISLLIVFLNIQNKSVNIDHLTKVNNRKRLDAYVKDKVSSSTRRKTFSAIMVDMDNFKTINDTYGHDMGDKVLKITARLLKSCIGGKGFIARYGGDEFCIILDICDTDALKAMIKQIKSCFEKYNMSGNIPFKLDLSMGSAVYDYRKHMTAEEFQKHIDILMYENKKVKHKVLNY